MRREVLGILPETKEPILVIALPGRHQRRTLLPTDDLAVLLDCMATQTGMRLIRYPAKRGLKLGDLRDVERADCDSWIFIVFGKIVGNSVSFRFSYDRMLRWSFFQIPTISFSVERGFFAGQPSNQPRPLIFTAGPDQIGCLQIEPR